MKTLAEHLQDYLKVRRQLGFKLSAFDRDLGKFVRFLRQEKSLFITTKLTVQWITQSTSSEPCRAALLSMVRGFARYLSAVDPRNELPPVELFVHRRWRKTPYLYSKQEVARLIAAAGHLPTTDRLRPATYSTLFGLLAATGMRIGEAIGLDREDIDLDQDLLTLRRTKGGAWRLVPIHSTVGAKLRQYACFRDRTCPKPKSPAFFVSGGGTRIKYNTTHEWFLRLSYEIGLRHRQDRHGPRIHDLRHYFAIQTLVRWYRGDLDATSRLPNLSTYLGHSEVANTYWYISATPELLRLATQRLAREKGGPGL